MEHQPAPAPLQYPTDGSDTPIETTPEANALRAQVMTMHAAMDETAQKMLAAFLGLDRPMLTFDQVAQAFQVTQDDVLSVLHPVVWGVKKSPGRIRQELTETPTPAIHWTEPAETAPEEVPDATAPQQAHPWYEHVLRRLWRWLTR